MIKWKYFLTKRRLTPSSFVAARNITSYELLITHLNSLGVELPPFDEVNHLFMKVRSSSQAVGSKVEKLHSDDSVPANPAIDVDSTNNVILTTHVINEAVFSESSIVTSDVKQLETRESKKRRRVDKTQSVKKLDLGISDADSQE